MDNLLAHLGRINPMKECLDFSIRRLL